MKNKYLTVIVLTYNESIHIERCIQSIKKLTDNLIVVDSYSTDDTVAIAEKNGAAVKQNRFINHADQLNWAIQNGGVETEWTMRLDADEYLTDELIEELRAVLPVLKSPVNGLAVNYRHYFWGRWIKHGTRYPLTLLRIWRTGYGMAENKWMDEKLVLKEGEIYNLKNDFIHEDLNTLSFFINKHNEYATREAIDLLNKKYHLDSGNYGIENAPVSKRHFNRRMKEKFYSQPSLIWIRSFAYFIYRYFFRLGFLDGKEGFVYHLLQGFWFRFLADMKSIEIERLAKEKKLPITEAIRLYRRQ